MRYHKRNKHTSKHKIYNEKNIYNHTNAHTNTNKQGPWHCVNTAIWRPWETTTTQTLTQTQTNNHTNAQTNKDLDIVSRIPWKTTRGTNTEDQGGLSEPQNVEISRSKSHVGMLRYFERFALQSFPINVKPALYILVLNSCHHLPEEKFCGFTHGEASWLHAVHHSLHFVHVLHQAHSSIHLPLFLQLVLVVIFGQICVVANQVVAVQCF